MSEILSIKNINRTYRQGDKSITVLSQVNLTIQNSETVALVGPSGAGKSTLLHIAGLLERADSGSIFVGGKSAGAISERLRTDLRLWNIGFVYQHHHLMTEFSALENIMLPQLIAGVNSNRAKKRALDLLSDIGLLERKDHRPSQLSGGEQQRVSIGRALANNPEILIADEPTGNLDHTTSLQIIDLLLNLAIKDQLSILMATHNLQIAKKMNSLYRIEGGNIIKQNALNL